METNLPKELRQYLDNLENLFSARGSDHRWAFFITQVTDLLRYSNLHHYDYKFQIPIVIECINFDKIELTKLSPKLQLHFKEVHTHNMLVDGNNALVIFNNCEIQTLRIQDPSESTITLIDTEIGHFVADRKCHISMVRGSISHLDFSTEVLKTEKLTFQNLTIEKMGGTALATTKRINHVHFNNVYFKHIFETEHMKFGQDTDFNNCIFNIIGVEKEYIFRHLKFNFTDNKNEFLSNLFASLELKCKHLGIDRKKNKREFFFSFCHKWINDFGLDAYRPLYYILGISGLVFLAVGIIFNLENGFHDFLFAFLGPFKLLAKKGNFSFVDDDSTPIQQIFELSINVSTSLFWFFLILGIRKRFKIDK